MQMVNVGSDYHASFGHVLVGDLLCVQHRLASSSVGDTAVQQQQYFARKQPGGMLPVPEISGTCHTYVCTTRIN